MWYTLNDQNEPESATTEQWIEWCKKYPCRKVVGRTKIGETFISTVFLGLDHDWGGGRPVLWETMIFSKDANNQYMDRYTSLDQAVFGHEKTVRAVIEGKNLNDSDEQDISR